MRKLSLSYGIAAAAVMLAATVANAGDAATRTWVSGVGDDYNPCSRTAPCKTFAGAISKTAAGGEISVLDPGGYGTVTVTKSISIVNDNSGEAGILASEGTTGIVVNAGPYDVVSLRGLYINGGIGLTSGSRGVRFFAGGALHIQNCTIANFRSGLATGIEFSPSASAKLTVRDTHIVQNGFGPAFGGGIVVKPTGGFSSVTLSRVTLDNNHQGLLVDTTANAGGGAFVTVLDSSASANKINGFALTGNGSGSQSFLAIDRSASSNNANGLVSTGGNSTILVSNTVVTGNTLGVSAVAGGKIESFGNNMFGGNVSKGAVTSTVQAD